MKMYTLLTVWMLLAAASDAATSSRPAEHSLLSSRRLTMTDGLPGNNIYDMVQDDQGFIWFGASYGLCRYDGYSAVSYYSLSERSQKPVEANVGNLYIDSARRLLWIHTATYTLACYDLEQGRFVDYTAGGDNLRSYRRMLRCDGELWLFDPWNGMRHVSYKEGRFCCTDYNKENGRLATNRVNRLVEHPLTHDIWALTDQGVYTINDKGQPRLLARGNYVEGTTDGQRILTLRSDNVISVFAPPRQHHIIPIPSPLGTPGTVKSHFVWQGQWLIFGNSTYSLNLRDLTVSKPETLQLSGGLLLDSIDGYHFEGDKAGRLLLFPPKGNVRELKLMPELRLTTERQRKYNIVRGKDGRFYIASYGRGLFVYNPDNGQTEHFTADDEKPVIDTDFLLKTMRDKQGNIWVAQDAMGVACITADKQDHMQQLLPAPGRKGDGGNFVRMVAKRSDGSVMVGTRDNKLYRLDWPTRKFELKATLPAAAYGYKEDSRGHIWIATRGGGLTVDGRAYTRQDATYHCPTNDLIDIAEDSQGRIWIATYEDGLLMTQYREGEPLRFKQLLNRSINESRQHQLAIGNDGRIWVATNNGLYTADTRKNRIGNEDFANYNRDNSLLPFNETRCVMKGSDGWIWTGGTGSGIVRCRFDAKMKMTECVQTTNRQGLANNNICCMAEDGEGNVWAGTENGLSRIHAKSHEVNTFRQPKGRFGQDIFSVGCALCLPDGTMALGTRDGLTLIAPHQNDDTLRRKPTVCITNISINGTLATDSSRFGAAPNRSSHIELAHNENTLGLSFTNFEYAHLESSLYQFYLEGAEHQWRSPTSMNHVEYSHLAPGTYVFHLRALCNNVWSEERQLTITVRQPWYNTWWAWLLYMAALASLAFYIYRNARERLRLHEQMKVEKQLTKFRMDFFTSVAHEFRTPLAIIAGAVERMKQSKAYDQQATQTAQRGTHRLLRLVNQLMEFRKLNTGNLRLKVEAGNIVGFVRDIVQDFWSIAKQKDMQLTFMPFQKSFEVPFDRQMVETIVYNLLSNAVKYGKERGAITVRMRKDEQWLRVAVEDNGPGISREQEQKLFEPFMKGYASAGGMGIGLYTAHKMAQLHKGSLGYERSGELTVFTLTLPANADDYQPDDYQQQKAIEHEEQRNEEAEEIVREMLPKAYNDLTVAIIEDDPDMMEQTKSEVGVYFQTVGFANGQSAIEAIRKEKPALVICDVMLPDISGYDICTRLKNDPLTAQIPVVMLTALDDENHQLKSYKANADDYMVKPCNYRLLIGRIVQLIKKSNVPEKAAEDNQRTEVNTTAHTADAAASPTIITSQADKVFLNRLQMSIAQHISDTDFSVDQLAVQLNMGRTKLYNKTKELTGLSPNKYLMRERMETAGRLLLEGELTVAEVGYRVGISDASYFNKCFKQHFGVVPSKYGR